MCEYLGQSGMKRRKALDLKRRVLTTTLQWQIDRAHQDPFSSSLSEVDGCLKAALWLQEIISAPIDSCGRCRLLGAPRPKTELPYTSRCSLLTNKEAWFVDEVALSCKSHPMSRL